VKTIRYLFPALVALFLLVGCHPDEILVVRELNPSGEAAEDDPDDVDWDAAVGYVFDGTVIPEVHVAVTVDEWNRLLKAYDRNADTQEYIECDVRYVKGEEVTEISRAGLRLKGNTSRRRPEGSGGQTHRGDAPDWHHFHLSLDFHQYVRDAEHTLKGVRRVDLKWFKDDPAYVREIYCYDLFRSYGVWTAVRDVYARLWIRVGDGEEAYFGVYGMLEHVDRNYLRARKDLFGSKDGNLWKCRHPADLRSTGADFGVDDDARDHTYELKTNKEEGFEAARDQLKDFIGNLNTLSGTAFDTWIASVTDVDLLLRTCAVNVAVGMWDDYWNNANNYYLYFDRAEGTGYRVYLIPYDYDNTLGTSIRCGVQDDAGRQDPYGWGSPSNPLMVKILENQAWRNAYRAHLQELCRPGGLFYYTCSIARIQSWQARIRDYVSNDTGEDMSISDRPASWGSHGEYRLLDTGSGNFFKVKAASVSAME